MVEPTPTMAKNNPGAQEERAPGAVSGTPMTRPLEQTGGFDETAVVDRARHGDFRAFTELVERYAATVLRLTRHFTRSQGEAEEVLQGTFLEAYEELSELRSNCEVRPWLIRIAVKQALTRPGAPTKDRADWLDEPCEVEGETATQENPDLALESLRPVLRAVFVLRDVEGIRTEDTAAILDLPVQEVRRLLLWARMQLRERLSPYFMGESSETRAGQTQFRPPAFSC